MFKCSCREVFQSGMKTKYIWKRASQCYDVFWHSPIDRLENDELNNQRKVATGDFHFMNRNHWTFINLLNIDQILFWWRFLQSEEDRWSSVSSGVFSVDTNFAMCLLLVKVTICTLKHVLTERNYQMDVFGWNFISAYFLKTIYQLNWQ